MFLVFLEGHHFSECVFTSLKPNLFFRVFSLLPCHYWHIRRYPFCSELFIEQGLLERLAILLLLEPVRVCYLSCTSLQGWSSWQVYFPNRLLSVSKLALSHVIISKSPVVLFFFIFFLLATSHNFHLFFFLQISLAQRRPRYQALKDCSPPKRLG